MHLSLVQLKALNGDPHYIAMGMGIGVFVGVTPTIPFHMVLAVGLAFIVKGSKPAALIGVWFSNPLTIPFFYWGSYKTGGLILGNTTSLDPAVQSVSSLFQQGLDVALATIAGGIILGIVPGIIAYLITLRLFTIIRSRKENRISPRSTSSREQNR
ncbi:MAG: DUF2062 domain-containing protein [Desulfobacterales bacterium]